MHKNWDKDIADFLAWKESHERKCESNLDGSSDSMEPVGLVQLFKRSLDNKLCYKHFASDVDSSTLASLMKENPYGKYCEIVKEDCIGIYRNEWVLYFVDQWWNIKASFFHIVRRSVALVGLLKR